jgi:enterochelin esterase-like enzyme
MLVLLVIASGSGDLFIFSPDVGLHTAPIIRQNTPPPQQKQHNGQNVPLPTHGTIVQESMISAALGGQKKSFLVYLPPSYNTPQGQSHRYPAVYLLHGSPGAAHDWFTAGKADQSADTLIALGKIPELILILPDGNGQEAATSEWGNSFDQKQLIETYVAVDLVKYVDQKYRTLAQAAYRGIGGLSMGGFGAMNIAVHHPNVFGTVISLGGYYYAEGSIWGNNTAYIQQNSPADVFPGDKPAWKLHIYLGAATSDEPYYTDTKQFARELDTLHVPYHLDIQNGYHSWGVWQTQMYNALLWLHWG